jgi:hypothetical protein
MYTWLLVMTSWQQNLLRDLPLLHNGSYVQLILHIQSGSLLAGTKVSIHLPIHAEIVYETLECNQEENAAVYACVHAIHSTAFYSLYHATQETNNHPFHISHLGMVHVEQATGSVLSASQYSTCCFRLSTVFSSAYVCVYSHVNVFSVWIFSFPICVHV